MIDLFITSNTDWRNKAACRPPGSASLKERTTLAETFYPLANPSFDAHGQHNAKFVEQAQKALRICAACPVRAQCLQASLNQPQPHKDLHAVEGGTLPGQRAMLRKQLAKLATADQDAEADHEPAFAA